MSYVTRLLGFAHIVLSVAAMPTTSAAEDSPSGRPNIVFLLADDQCTNSLGCYGTNGVSTVNLDALARDGMVFDRHYVTTAICMASRVNIMTGKYEFNAGCNFDKGNLLREHWQQSYPMLLRESGYLTAFAGKFGFTVTGNIGGQGTLPEADFDWWGGGPGQTFYETKKNASMAEYAGCFPHATLSYGAFARDVIRQASTQSSPFCLSISFKAPHRPVAPDPQFDAVYAGKSFEKPENYGREHGAHFSQQSRLGRQYERFTSWNYADDYDAVMQLYYQQIYAIDVAVGMIRQSLVDFGCEQDTVIIYTSDNGFLCGAHGYGSKVLPYEESSRVPLIIYDPRQSKVGRSAARCHQLTGNVDVAATILALADLAAPPTMDGKNLMRLYASPDQTLHDYLPLINVWGPREVHSLSVVTHRGKMIYWPYAGDGFASVVEAYDIQRDPLELANIANASQQLDLTAELNHAYTAILGQWRERGVKYHGYKKFATIFDPAEPWPEKDFLYRND